MFAFEMIMYRELEQDAMTWQTPALALTAQSFLLTIALDSTATTGARALAAGLGILVAVMSLQLMAKHIYLCNVDRAQLRQLEECMGLPKISQRQWGDGVRGMPSRGFLERRSSGVWWIRGMMIFALANAAVIIVVLVEPVQVLLGRLLQA
jgi:hypothetical protein